MRSMLQAPPSALRPAAAPHAASHRRRGDHRQVHALMLEHAGTAASMWRPLTAHLWCSSTAQGGARDVQVQQHHQAQPELPGPAPAPCHGAWRRLPPCAASASAAGSLGGAGGLNVLQSTRPVDRLRYQAKLLFDQLDTEGKGQAPAAAAQQGRCCGDGEYSSRLPPRCVCLSVHRLLDSGAARQLHPGVLRGPLWQELECQARHTVSHRCGRCCGMGT